MCVVRAWHGETNVVCAVITSAVEPTNATLILLPGIYPKSETKTQKALRANIQMDP